ncbi:MAG: tetratricopeptide repeat protein, partial [Saprospiraceae bacterium]|nr:tetratricopeptide repeat protein [Saprospiraceae bacterium]
ELDNLSRLSKNEEIKELTIWEINSVSELLNIAKNVLHAEILASEEKYEESIALLQKAVAIEDNLNYNEPPDWFFSVRHRLGAVQIEAGDYRSAIETYKEDLERLPKNGWALHGLRLVYEHQDNRAMVKNISDDLTEVWANADVELEGSRIK